MRVVINENPDKLITLMTDIIDKETAVAPNGVLTPGELTALTALRDTAKTANKEQVDLYKLAEEKTRTRDNALGITAGMKVDQPGTGMYTITYVRDILLAKNKTNPKVLGEWGFVVDDSPQAGAPPPPPGS